MTGSPCGRPGVGAVVAITAIMTGQGMWQPPATMTGVTPHPAAEQYGPPCPVCEGRNVDEQRCGMCGGPVDAHDRQIRFRLPEPVLDSPEQGRVPGAWLSHESPEASVMMQFVRALLAVRLTGVRGDLRRLGRGSSR